MRLQPILFILASLTIFSTLSGGILYYSAFQKSALEKEKLESELRVSSLEYGFSAFLEKNRQIVDAFSRLNEIKSVFLSNDPAVAGSANKLLFQLKNSLEADVCYLINLEGVTVASSNFDQPDSFIGRDYSFRPYFTEAMGRLSSVYLALGVTSGKRGIYFSHTVLDKTSDRKMGIFVMKISVDVIDNLIKYSDHEQATLAMLVDPNGIIFMSSRDDLLFKSFNPLSDETLETLKRSRQFGDGPWEWSGFKSGDKGILTDQSGNGYAYGVAGFGDLSGWKIYSLVDLKQISDSVRAPFIESSGYLVILLGVLVGLSVIILYRLAKFDLQRRKQAEEALRDSQKVFNSFADNFPAAVFIKDRNNRFIYKNTASSTRNGKPDSNYATFQFEQNEEVEKEDEAVIQNGFNLSERIVRQFEKEDQIFNVYKFLIKQSGKDDLIGGFALNVTEQKKIENDLKESKDELESRVSQRTKELELTNIDLQREVSERQMTEEKLIYAKDQAEMANKAKSEFLSNMSHELRTPMHHIINYSKFGVEKINGADLDKLQHYFEQIQKTSKRLLVLLNDLLDLSKLESGRMDYHFEKTDLFQLAESLRREFLQYARSKRIYVRIEKPDVSTQVECDKGRIYQVFQNLVSNGIKFSNSDSELVVNFETSTIYDIAQLIDPEPIQAVQVGIIDNGIGIPPQELEMVFDKFIQSSKTKTGAGGTGLGLAICKQIVLAHGGNIWAKNNPEGGTTFMFTLPYHQQR